MSLSYVKYMPNYNWLHIFLFQGIDGITKSHFKKKYDSKTKIFYYAKVGSERSKNHQRDDEDLEIGGIIPFVTNERGLNGGLYMELSFQYLNPEIPAFFQKPKRESKKFNIHNPRTKIYYEKSKVGITFVAAMLPKLCQVLRLERRYTNCNIRYMILLLIAFLQNTCMVEFGYSEHATKNLAHLPLLIWH